MGMVLETLVIYVLMIILMTRIMMGFAVMKITVPLFIILTSLILMGMESGMPVI
jgi:ABC-type multidrug transport system permease subunit